MHIRVSYSDKRMTSRTISSVFLFLRNPEESQQIRTNSRVQFPQEHLVDIVVNPKSRPSFHRSLKDACRAGTREKKIFVKIPRNIGV